MQGAVCVVWKEYKKEKRERESVEGKTKTRGWEGGKKKRRERGEEEVDARPRYRHRAVVTCASDRRRVAEAGVSS